MKKLYLAVCLVLMMIFPCACNVQGNVTSEEKTQQTQDNMIWTKLQKTGEMTLQYATEFAVDDYEGGYALITVADQDRYLLVPEQAAVPDGLDTDIVVLRQPLDRIYAVSTSVMDLFRASDSLDAVRFTGLESKDWYIQAVQERMDAGDILYAGKYRAPDYELLLSENCNLAIENTMIYHEPSVKEQLEKLGIPVFVEYSSYESHPLGRMEWIRLYGLLTGNQETADAYFSAQAEKLQGVETAQTSGKTVAFFYVTANGAVNIRKSGDYVTEMIRLAGGAYVPEQEAEGDSNLSTMNMQMEAFYDAAKDADYLIYNSTIDNVLTSLEDLYAKSDLFRDFKAVREGNVWCTGKNMFQESTATGDMIVELNRVISGNGDDAELVYLHRLQ